MNHSIFATCTKIERSAHNFKVNWIDNDRLLHSIILAAALTALAVVTAAIWFGKASHWCFNAGRSVRSFWEVLSTAFAQSVDYALMVSEPATDAVAATAVTVFYAVRSTVFEIAAATAVTGSALMWNPSLAAISTDRGLQK